MIELHKVKVRAALKPRREPYWGPAIGRGQVVGFRKIDADTGSWVARMRDEAGRKIYRKLGYVRDGSATRKREPPLSNGSKVATPA